MFNPKPSPSDDSLPCGVYIQTNDLGDSGLVISFQGIPKAEQDIAFLQKLGAYPMNLLPRVIMDIIHKELPRLAKLDPQERPLAIPVATWEAKKMS